MTMVIERTTTASSDEAPTGFAKLCQVLEQVDAALPDGYSTEIIEGKIVVSPWSKGSYYRILDSLQDQLAPHVPEGHRARCGPSLYVFPQHERAFGPDLHVVDRDAARVRSIFLPGSALSLVAEQTSRSTRDSDLVDKAEV